MYEIGDRVIFNWDKFTLFHGYYPDHVENIKHKFGNNKRHFITKIKPHSYFEYMNHYEIDNKLWVHKDMVTKVNKTIIDKIIIKYIKRK